MIKPIEDKVIVRPKKDSEKTTLSGLVIAGNNDSAIERAEVIAVGTGIILNNGTHVPLNISVGDIVMYSAFAGQEVEDGGEKVLLLSYRDIFAIVED